MTIEAMNHTECGSEKLFLLLLFLNIQCVKYTDTYAFFVKFHFECFVPFINGQLFDVSFNEWSARPIFFFTIEPYIHNEMMLLMSLKYIPFAKINDKTLHPKSHLSFVFIFSDYFQNSSYIVYGMQCSLKVVMTQPTWSLPESHKSSWILNYMCMKTHIKKKSLNTDEYVERKKKSHNRFCLIALLNI